ncbi:hypothetical protein REPUB_Repub09cG0124400 [Reevesia pubescens]
MEDLEIVLEKSEGEIGNVAHKLLIGKIHNLPLELLTKQNAVTIGRILRDLESVDHSDWKDEIGRSFLQIRVAMDHNMFLKKSLWVLRATGDKIWAEVTKMEGIQLGQAACEMDDLDGHLGKKHRKGADGY